MKLTFLSPIALTFLLAACSILPSRTLGTATPRPPTETPVLSPTPVWFPPTETPTPRARSSPSPTPDLRPGIGDLIPADNFTDETAWNIFESDPGTAALVHDQLTLSAAPGVYLLSLNKELVLTNFHAEVTAHINLCRGADEYGLLVRAIPVTYYRFALTCDGHLRAERVSRDERNPLQSVQVSGDAPRGAPATVRIAIWVVGREMRLFLNDNFQFRVSDSNLRTGSLGFYVRAAGGTPVTVSFSDLVIHEVNYTPPTAEP